MARYLLLRVASPEAADKLMAKFEPLETVETVGLFAAPDKFCEGKCDNEGRSVRSKKWGTYHCPVCKLPKKTVMQHPRNLLQDLGLHPRFIDCFLSVWEPFHNKPEEAYGAEAIERKQQSVANSTRRVTRARRRRARNGG